MPGLDEGHGQLRGEKPELREDDECGRDRCRNDRLPEELGARGEAQVAPLDHLDVVVGKADGAEGKSGENRDPDEGICRVAPEQGRQNDGDHDEQATHGGSARLFLMRLRPVLADVLADLEFAQLLDDVRTDEKRDEECGKRGEGGAEREIAKDAEGMKEREELFVKQPVKQGDSSALGKDSGRFYRGWSVGAGDVCGAGRTGIT